MKKHVIWSNDCETIEALEKDIKENPDDFVAGYSKDDDFWAIACQMNDDYLDDERVNLNVCVGTEIIIIADLGLWNGRYPACKRINSDNIRDCLYSDTDYVTWYIDEYGDLRCEASHHDGINYYTYRAWKDGVSETQKTNFLQKVWAGKSTRKDITRYTRKIGPYVADVYGWKVKR